MCSWCWQVYSVPIATISARERHRYGFANRHARLLGVDDGGDRILHDRHRNRLGGHRPRSSATDGAGTQRRELGRQLVAVLESQLDPAAAVFERNYRHHQQLARPAARACRAHRARRRRALAQTPCWARQVAAARSSKRAARYRLAVSRNRPAGRLRAPTTT